MTPALWPLRLIPRRSPPFITGLVITAGAMAASMAIRGLLLGWPQAVGLSATIFPALILATLYAGSGWGWLALAVSLVLSRLTPLTTSLSEAAVLAMFIFSAGLTVVVSSSLRSALIRLDEANAAQADAQRSLEVTEARFRSLADSAPVLMWVTHIDGLREFANQAYVDFLGEPYATALNYDWRKVLHPDDLTRILQEQVAGEASRQLFSLEARYRRHDGEYRWIRFGLRPARPGRRRGVHRVGYDTSDAKRAEEDLADQRPAARAGAGGAGGRDWSRRRCSAQLERRGQLTGGGARLQQLLTGSSALDLMQRHPTDEDRRERTIEAAAARRRAADPSALPSRARPQLEPAGGRLPGDHACSAPSART